MRVAAIFPPGRRDRYWQPFHQANDAEWTIGLPASAAEADVILIFGGDGTLHRYLADLVKLQVPVLVVPCGGGNDMARALGLHRRTDSLAAWRRFCGGGNNVRTIDLGLIQPTQPPADGAPAPAGQYFCTVGGVGLDAQTARRANQLPSWLRRRGGYVISMLLSLAQLASVKMNLETERCETEAVANHPKSAVLTAFANGPAYGGGMKIAPRAQLDDGKLDICVVRDVSKFKLLCLFPTVFFGRHLSMAEVEYFQAERLQLETEEPSDVYADGEFVCRTPIEVSVAKRALQVIVPVSVGAGVPARAGSAIGPSAGSGEDGRTRENARAYIQNKRIALAWRTAGAFRSSSST